MSEDALLALLQCPRCAPRGVAGALAPAGEKLRCAACAAEYPRVGGIPCLFREPHAVTSAWKRQAGQYVGLVHKALQGLDEQLQRTDVLRLTRRRFEALRLGIQDNGERLMALFTGAGLAPDESAARAAGGTAGDPAQLVAADFEIVEWYDHILRDWSQDRHDSPENVTSLRLVGEAIGDDRQLGRVVVLGAGACRLAYDVQRKWAADLTLAVDINPLLLLAARRVMFGTGLRLHEFPVVPVDLAAVAAERSLGLPGGPPKNFHLVLADAYSGVLRRGCADTVITPWFIDFVPVDLRETLSLIHELLAPGGRWLHFGPLSYPRELPAAQRYGADELMELVRRAGFDRGPVASETVELIGSPAKAQTRSERVLCFAARKRPAPDDPADDGDEPPPSWLLFSHLPIPRFPGLDTFQPPHAAMAYIAKQIDGKTTLGDIAARMIAEHGARPDAAVGGTRALLALVYQAASP
jgi:hypothetical protein